jgi:hypothetical protein
MVESWIDHILHNMHIYEFSHEADPHFMTAVLFHIDKAASIYIRSCQEAESLENINSKVLQMENAQNSIVEQNFHQPLPPGLIPIPKVNPDYDPNKWLKKEDDGSPNGLKKGGRPKPKGKLKDNDEQQVQNPNKQFLLEKGENFAETFYKAKNLASKENDTPVCLSYWIRGYCSENCPRIHAKISAATETALAEFIANCRAGKNSKKGNLNFGDRVEDAAED